MKLLLLLSGLPLLVCATLRAQDRMTVLEYTIGCRPVDTPDSSACDSLSNHTMTISYTDSWTRVDYNQATEGTIVLMCHRDSSYLLNLFDAPGWEVAVSVPRSDGNYYKDADSAYIVKKDRRRIMSYRCYRAVSYNRGIPTENWVSRDRDFRFHSSVVFPDLLGGLPLQFTTVENGLELTYTLNRMEERNVSSGFFTYAIPENYYLMEN